MPAASFVRRVWVRASDNTRGERRTHPARRVGPRVARSGQIQQLKNDGVVGEDRDGYLAMRSAPSDPKYLAYAQGVVSAENADRSYLYLTNAQNQNKPLEMIEREYAQLWSDRAFPGEWVQKENGTWIKK